MYLSSTFIMLYHLISISIILVHNGKILQNLPFLSIFILQTLFQSFPISRDLVEQIMEVLQFSVVFLGQSHHFNSHQSEKYLSICQIIWIYFRKITILCRVHFLFDYFISFLNSLLILFFNSVSFLFDFRFFIISVNLIPTFFESWHHSCLRYLRIVKANTFQFKWLKASLEYVRYYLLLVGIIEVNIIISFLLEQLRSGSLDHRPFTKFSHPN